MENVRFLKKGIRANGKYFPAWYSEGPYTEQSGLPEGTITVYAKDILIGLPKELNPTNDSDMMTDYFEKDRARILPSSPLHKPAFAALKGKRLF